MKVLTEYHGTAIVLQLRRERYGGVHFHEVRHGQSLSMLMGAKGSQEGAASPSRRRRSSVQQRTRLWRSVRAASPRPDPVPGFLALRSPVVGGLPLGRHHDEHGATVVRVLFQTDEGCRHACHPRIAAPPAGLGPCSGRYGRLAWDTEEASMAPRTCQRALVKPRSPTRASPAVSNAPFNRNTHRMRSVRTSSSKFFCRSALPCRPSLQTI